MSKIISTAIPGSARPDVEELSRNVVGLDLPNTLQTVANAFAPGRFAVVSAFGTGSLVVLHELHRIGVRLPVIFVDTLHHFPQTLEHIERVRDRYDLDIRIFRPAASLEEFEKRHGPELWKRDLDRYQQVAKVEPFRRATADLDGWFTGRRREQAYTRADLPLIEAGDAIRVNPLIEWTRTDVWNFILDNDIPYNPLHDLGYTSIGDEPVTTPVDAGEDERAGRWRGSGRTECGIHDT